jgi:hypothetical protein
MARQPLLAYEDVEFIPGKDAADMFTIVEALESRCLYSFSQPVPPPAAVPAITFPDIEQSIAVVNRAEQRRETGLADARATMQGQRARQDAMIQRHRAARDAAGEARRQWLVHLIDEDNAHLDHLRQAHDQRRAHNRDVLREAWATQAARHGDGASAEAEQRRQEIEHKWQQQDAARVDNRKEIDRQRREDAQERFVQAGQKKDQIDEARARNDKRRKAYRETVDERLQLREQRHDARSAHNQAAGG